MTTYLFDMEWLNPLTESKIPITVFVHRENGETGPIINDLDDLNIRAIKMIRNWPMRFGTFHSKLILYEFNDRLRVIISSANLVKEDWLDYSQVIWF